MKYRKIILFMLQTPETIQLYYLNSSADEKIFRSKRIVGLTVLVATFVSESNNTTGWISICHNQTCQSQVFRIHIA